jgi:S1-C subfamily serine protease
MKSKTLAFLLLWLAGLPTVAQAGLPPCPTDPNIRWHACQGRYTWTNGDVYAGEWLDDKRHGQGTDTFANGHRYTGGFADGRRHGSGTYTFPNGERYVGEWRNGEREGVGANIFPSGERHVGEWREGKRQGPGISYAADGSIVQSGRWAEDRWAQALPPDTARFPFRFAQSAAPSQTDEALRRAEAAAQAERRRRETLEQELAEERRRRTEAEQRSSTEAEGGSSGTGFSIAPGFLVTNEHVVAGCRRVEVHSLDGRRAGAVVDTDDLVDLALVRVTGLGGSTVPLRRPGSVRLGEAAYAFGFPLSGLLSNSGNFTNGVVSGLRGLRDSANEIQITTPVQPGNSGGAVIDASGQAIGVVVSKLDASAVARATGDIPQNVNFAVSLSALVDFLQRNRVPFRQVDRGPALETHQIAETARAFTHRIVCAEAAPDPAAGRQGAPAAAAAADTTVELLNDSREAIHEIRVSPVKSTAWGPDLLGDEVLMPGKRFTLEPPATDGCRYDVLVKYQSGETDERRDQDFCTLVELKFRGRGR